MPTETIEIDGQRIKTLAEFLAPGLRVVFVGLNPSPTSVEKGHYYQGRLGRRFWRRLQEHGVTKRLPDGREDQAAFASGYGFADLVRRPTVSAKELTATELTKGAVDLIDRLQAVREPKPIVVFVFAKAAKVAASTLEKAGYRTFRMPGPYAKREDAEAQLRDLASMLREHTACVTAGASEP